MTSNHSNPYAETDPPRHDIDLQPGATLLEFGSNDCGICAAAQPRIGQALAAYPHIRHIKIEDGRGRRLGRSFGVKLWPTLVFLQDGQEIARLVRPQQDQPIQDALARLAEAQA
ncbi:thioredoxin family protein [soil metagenome]